MLGHQTAFAAIIMVGTRVLTRFTDLLTLLVLAHELKPTDFGLVALAMSLILIAEAIFELPLSQAMVRLPKIEQADFDTAFTLSILRGFGVMTVLWLISWPFAYFYNDNRLVLLICVLSVSPAARGASSPRLAEYAKTMSFWRESTIELSGKAIAFVVAITLVFATKSYWSIAAGTVVTPIIMGCVSYMLAPYRPRLSLSRWRVFADFLGWISLAQTINAINWQSDRLLLGKLFGRFELGLFSTANDLSTMPVQSVFNPIMRPLMAAFSSVGRDTTRLGKVYQTSAIAAVTIGLPILVGEALVATPTVHLLLGPRWAAAAPLLKWLAVSMIPALFAMPFGPLVMAYGKTEYFLKRNAFEFCIKLPLVILGAIYFGFLGVIGARVISETATALYCNVLTRQLIGLGVVAQILGAWRSILAATIMVPAVLVTQSYIYKNLPGATAVLILGLSAIIGASWYLLSIGVLWCMAGRPAGIEAMAVDRLSRIKPQRRPKVLETL